MISASDYGKRNVTFYRTYAKPLSGITPIEESTFFGRDNIVFAADVDVQVFGDNFLPAYTEGDNSGVVATDTMKNFILQQALDYEGATQEGFLDFLGRQFLETYPQMQALTLSSKEVPFEAAVVPEGEGFTTSQVLFSRSHNDYSFAELSFARQEGITSHRCGRLGLQLIKVTGSSFACFVRDAYTTLPEQYDRPLFIYLDVYWRYGHVNDMLSTDRYVAAEQVADLAGVVFHEFVSMSIQHLLHEMGKRLLKRFSQLSGVSFRAQNRLWDTAFVSEKNPTLKVYADPRPPYGDIGLTMTRDD